MVTRRENKTRRTFKIQHLEIQIHYSFELLELKHPEKVIYSLRKHGRR